MEYLWMAVVAMGPLLLGLAIAFALLRRRPTTSGELRRRRQAVERLYRNEPRPPAPISAGEVENRAAPGSFT